MPTKEKIIQSSNKGGGVAFGVTSMVTGIVALLVGWNPFMSLPLGTVAIVFGFLGIKKPDSRGMAIAGLVTGIIGVLAGLFLFVVGMVALSQSNTYMPMQYYRY
jgi:uncharacterized membrane protein